MTGKPAQVLLSQAQKATVVVFLSAQCPCSSGHEQELNRLSKEYTTKGFQFLGVHSNADEDAEQTRAHFSSSGFSFPVIQDKEFRWANLLGAFKTPHVYVLSPKGEILFQGGVDDSRGSSESAKRHYLRVALQAIAEGQEPAQKEVRTLGCVIQR